MHGTPFTLVGRDGVEHTYPIHSEPLCSAETGDISGAIITFPTKFDLVERSGAGELQAVLDALKAGEIPPHGPQIDRQKSAPVGGPQTLKDLDFAEVD